MSQIRNGRDAVGGDEAGAILILALVFLVAVSLIVTALLTWVGAGLTASVSFASTRSVETAATSAVDLAIQETRGNFVNTMTNASPPVACWYSSYGAGLAPPTGPQQPPTTLDNEPIDVWCSMDWEPFSSSTRTITYSACPTANYTDATTDPATCAANPLLQAVVTFNDFTPGVPVAPSVNNGTPVPCDDTGLCGQSMTQDSWQWFADVPAVTSVSPTSSSMAGGGTLTINGSDFVNGAYVDLVQESNDVPTSSNTVLTVPSSAFPGDTVTFGGCSGAGETNCTLTTNIPPAIAGTDYFVTVTTPGGTSVYVPSPGSTSYNTLHYTVPSPSVSQITLVGGATPAQGAIGGGSTINITGANFFNATNFPAQIDFCANGTTCTNTTPCSSTSTTCVPASNIVVTSSTTISGSTPAVPAPGNWYLMVQTIGGWSANTGVYFAYNTVQVPLVISVTPTSGGPSSSPAVNQISVTGANFINPGSVCTNTSNPSTGTCAAFYLYNGGNQTGNAIWANVAVTSPTAMTVTIPSGVNAKGSVYVLIVTSYVSNTSYASQPYNVAGDLFTYTG